VQVFEGVVIKRQGHGMRETFTVRKQSFGVGVERMFPVHSPKIERIELAARGDVRRAKLYYLRDRVGKRARVRERRYSGPEETIEPGLLHEPVGATDADGLTAEETVLEQDAAVEAPETQDAQDGQPAAGEPAEAEGEQSDTESAELAADAAVAGPQAQDAAADAEKSLDAGADEGDVGGDEPA